MGFLFKITCFIISAYMKKTSDKNKEINEIGTKDCLTIASLRWKLLMSLGQVEPIYTHKYPYTR